MESQMPPLDKCTLEPDPADGPQQQWTYAEVAKLKRVSVQTVMEWVKRGKVPSPIYTGYTARFTTEHVASIMSENNTDGTYPVTPSPRSSVGKMGGSSKKPKKGKAQNPAQQTLFAKKSAAKKPAAKKPAAKKPAAKKPKHKPDIIDAGGGILVEIVTAKPKRKAVRS